MQILSAQDTRDRLPFGALIDALRTAFTQPVHAPLRHHHPLKREAEPEATMLLMPAWQDGGLGGLKFVNVVPGNSARNMPALSSSYLLFDNLTGNHLAMLDGAEITNRRTAAAAALGADYLARKDARKLLLVGSGRVASNIAPAMKCVRPIDEVQIWSPDPQSANTLAESLSVQGFSAQVVETLQQGVEWADIISCATLAEQPLIKGKWLRPGQHLDLIGSFTPKMREADDEAIRRARVFVDVEGALEESGDIIEPMKSGALSRDDVQATLECLCRNAARGRESEQEITLFKAVGTALEDLAAATLAYSNANEAPAVRGCK